MTFTPINEGLCMLKVKDSSTTPPLYIHAPTNDSNDVAKDYEVYEELERTYRACSGNNVKIVMGDADTKISREIIHHPTTDKYSLHETTNENGLRRISCTRKSTYESCTLQTDALSTKSIIV
jgi:hypothetical protein